MSRKRKTTALCLGIYLESPSVSDQVHSELTDPLTHRQDIELHLQWFASFVLTGLPTLRENSRVQIYIQSKAVKECSH